MIMIIICNRGSHLLRVIYNIMHFSGRSVVPLSTCSTFQWSANGHGPAPLPRPPAAAIQWQLYFSACDGCFETKFAKVQTIHSMINDSSGREEQHLASGQRKLAVGHNMSLSSSRDSPMRALAWVLNTIKKLEDWIVTEGRRKGRFIPHYYPFTHSVTRERRAQHLCHERIAVQFANPNANVEFRHLKSLFTTIATVRPCTMWHLWCELRFENW